MCPRGCDGGGVVIQGAPSPARQRPVGADAVDVVGVGQDLGEQRLWLWVIDVGGDGVTNRFDLVRRVAPAMQVFAHDLRAEPPVILRRARVEAGDVVQQASDRC